MSRRAQRTLGRVALGLTVLLVAALGLLRSAEAASVTVAWDSNRESDVTGYLIRYGTEWGQLTSTVDVGNHTTYQFTSLDPGHTYFFIVQAYNRGGELSAPSADVAATIGTAP